VVRFHVTPVLTAARGAGQLREGFPFETAPRDLIGDRDGINCAGTRVSDAVLEHLACLSNVMHLNLTRTQVSADGVAGLHNALPKWEVEWDSNPKK
jgi:hypothetical protein